MLVGFGKEGLESSRTGLPYPRGAAQSGGGLVIEGKTAWSVVVGEGCKNIRALGLWRVAELSQPQDCAGDACKHSLGKVNTCQSKLSCCLMRTNFRWDAPFLG